MGKFPSALLQRPRCGALSTSSTTSSSLTCTSSPLRPSLPSQCRHQQAASQVRHATFVPRERRPYQFTQLVQLSDGSTYTVRTTMPTALWKSSKDSRNHIMWQPTEKSLRNVELDEAGKLAAFRERFGRGWDLEAKKVEGEEEVTATATVVEGGNVSAAAAAAAGKKDTKQQQQQQQQTTAAAPAQTTPQQPAEPAEKSDDPFDSLVDLISGFAANDPNAKLSGLTAKEQEKKDKKKK